jgi:hypothetical protein
VLDLRDNCPVLANPDQADADSNRIGDACNDGEADATDACADSPASVPVDMAGCSQAQFCASFSGAGVIGMSICAASDWRNDEPLWRADDCSVRLSRRFSWPIPFTCEAQ